MKFARLAVLPAALLWLAAASAAGGRPLPDFASLVEAAAPAVVNISTTHADTSPTDQQGPFSDLFRRFFGEDGVPDGAPFDGPSLGSGFLIAADGHVLTSYHVVRGASEVVVTLSDRRQFVADVVGFDEDSDLALLKIDGSDLPVVRLGSSSALQVGEWVLAIGSPFGFEHSVTAGIVSAKGRSLRSERFVPFLQTDVAINPGNSGGPLFNLDGEVVGINSQIYSRTGGFQGVSFAIPVEVALDVVDQLRTDGSVSRGWLGVNVQDVSRELAVSFDMQRPEGALVTRVVPGSPAERAGVRVGDVILEFDGRAVERSATLPQLVGSGRGNRTVAIRVLREGRDRVMQVAVDELPRREPVVRVAAGPAPQDGPMGAVVEDPGPELVRSLDLAGYGVVVRDAGAGAARRAGIRDGDIILMVNQVRVRDRAHFAELAERLRRDRPAAVLVQRAGIPVFIAVSAEPPE
ncbi:MAG: Do family serine endopeptidase [Gammaproteobacteria bacterium]